MIQPGFGHPLEVAAWVQCTPSLGPGSMYSCPWMTTWLPFMDWDSCRQGGVVIDLQHLTRCRLDVESLVTA